METYGWLSLIPPLVAIALAIFSRRVLLSLFAGIVIGALIVVAGPFEVPANSTSTGTESTPVETDASENVATTPDDAEEDQKADAAVSESPTLFGRISHFCNLLCESLLWTNLIDGDHLRVFVFTTLMSCMVSVMHRGGAMQALVRMLEPLAKGRRGSQIITWLIGLLIFFDDYANTLLVGSSMQGVADRWKISREKLAYLVDSTAAPVAGLAIISTWVATEISFIEEGLVAQNVDFGSGFVVFVNTIPYRFYVLLALAYVAIVALSGRDFGPMLSAERKALSASPKSSPNQPESSSVARWYDAILPVAVILVVTLYLLVVTGWNGVSDASTASWLEIVGNGDSYVALQYAAVVGLAVSAILAFVQRRLKWSEIQAAIRDGAMFVVPALAILWFSWTLSALTGEDYLNTGAYLADKIGTSLPVFLLPTVTFVLAGGVAFATGTSWGTMGLLMPLVIKLTVQLITDQQLAVSSEDPILLGAIGGVLAGAIFGDHCSPISDTTVLSSQASGCDHIAHVRTQLPYAILVGVVSILFGTLPVGLGLPASLCCAIGFAVLIAFTFVVGRNSEAPAPK